MFHWPQSARLSVCAALLIVVLPCDLAIGSTQAQTSHQRGRVYITAQGMLHNIGGDDLEGDTMYAGDGCVYFVPDIDGSFMGRVAIGYRWRWIATEIAFSASDHDGSWMGDAMDVKQRIYSWDTKVSPNYGGVVQPYALVGFGFSRLRVNDGFIWYVEEDIWNGPGDEEFKGTCINLGAGLDIRISANLSLGLGFIYHRATYNTLSEVNQFEYDLMDNLTGTGFDPAVGLTLSIDL